MWKTVKLGEVLELQNGYAFKSKEYSQDGFFVMRITNVQQGYISAHNPKYVQIDSASKLTKFILDEGDILVSLTGDVGRVGVIREEHLPAALNQRVAKVHSVDASLDRHFLFLYLNSAIFRNQVEALGKGAAQANVSTKDILEITLELPPLAEQQRIVAKLALAFAEIDRAIDTEKRKLTNIAAARSSFSDSILAEITSERMRLEEAAFITNGYAFKSGSFTSEAGVPAIKITNVGIKTFVETSDVNLPRQFSEAHKQFRVEGGDIVFALTRTVISGGLKVAVVPESYDGALLNQRVAAVSAKQDIVTKQFLYACLSSSSVRDYVLDNVNTLMQPNLSISDLKRMPIPIPSKDEQMRMVVKLEEAESHFDSYESASNKKMQALLALKSAFLTQELHPPQSEAA